MCLKLTIGKTKFTGIILCAIIILSGALGLLALLGGHWPSAAAASTSTGSAFNYVIVILMENQNQGSVIGNSCCPYENGLANQYGLATNYRDIYSPSLPNYIALTSGSTQGITDDNGPSSHPLSVKNIVDSLETAGLSWKAYMENMPSNCYQSDSGSYYVRHNPFVYYTDITGNSARCAKVVPAGSGDSALLTDLNSTPAPNFMWLTPNGCNDTHDCSAATGDTYLAGLIPQILNSNTFKNQKAALMLIWDEYSPTPGPIFAGPAVKLAFRSSISYDHYSSLKTWESNWGLSTLASGDGSASPMAEFFTAPGSALLHASFTYSPSSPQAGQTITFTGSATAGTSPYTYSWTFGDSSTGTGQAPTHTYATSGSFSVTLTVTDSASPQNTATSTNTLTVAPLSPPDFEISANLASLSIQPGSTGTVTITLSSVSGFSGAVTLSTTVAPTGPTVSLSSSSITLVSGGTGTSILTVSTSSATSLATYSVIVAGSSGALLHSVTVAVTVGSQLLGLHVSGSRIVDQNGNPVTLVGLNYGDIPNDYPGGCSGGNIFHTCNPVSDAQNIKSSGFNAVNLVVEWNAFETSFSPSTYTYSSTYEQTLLARVNALTGQGLYVIVKLHGDATCYSGTGVACNSLQNFLGSGFCGGPGSSMGDSFYSTSAITNGSPASHLLKLFERISNDTATNSNVIGYDLLNEPWYCSGHSLTSQQIRTDWHLRVGEIIIAMRPRDHRIFFVEEAPNYEHYAAFTANDISDTNWLSSEHFYQGEYKTSSSSGTWQACFGDYATLSGLWGNTPSSGSCAHNTGLQVAQAQANFPNHAFMVGEFGDIYGNSPGDINEQWMTNAATVFRNFGTVGWIYWSSGSTGTWIKDITSLSLKPNFGVSANPSSLTIVQGTSGTSLITLTSLNALAGVITLSASISPSGTVAKVTPASITLSAGGSGISTLTISTASSTALGGYSVTVTGTNGTLAHSVIISVAVTAQVIQSLQGSISWTPTNPVAGESLMFTASASNGVQPYSFSWSLGDGSTASGASVTYAYSQAGNYTVKLTVADSSGITVVVQNTLRVVSASIVPGLLTVPGPEKAAVGSLLVFTVNASSPGFAGAIALSAADLPPGATFISAAGNPASGRFSWSPSQSVEPGLYVVTFNAVQAGSGYTAAKAVTINLAPGGTPCLFCGLSPLVWSTISLLTIGATLGLLVTAGFSLVRTHSIRSKRLSQLSTYGQDMPRRVALSNVYGTWSSLQGRKGSRLPSMKTSISRRVLDARRNRVPSALKDRARSQRIKRAGYR